MLILMPFFHSTWILKSPTIKTLSAASPNSYRKSPNSLIKSVCVTNLVATHHTTDAHHPWTTTPIIGASCHCSLRPRTRHGPWSPLIHLGCPRPWIYHGHLNSLPRSVSLYVLSLPLVSQFPLGSSRCQGSRLLRPGGRLSRLLRPGGRLSRLLRPGGRLSRLLRPGGRLSRLLRPGGRPSRLLRPGGRPSRLLRPGGRPSRLLRPGGRLSRLLRPGGRLTRLLRPGGRLTRQSHLTSPLTRQSHLTSPLTRQSLVTSPLTRQSLVTPQQFTQCHFTSLMSLPPHPGGLLFNWPHMDLALRSLPRFHLRSTALLDCAVCVKRLEATLWGEGGSVTNLVATHHTTDAHHPWTTTPIIHCTTTHTFPSTIAPITQLSPITH